jgi:hypothetical protein
MTPQPAPSSTSLNAELTFMACEIEGIDGAIAEANKRLTAARAAVARLDAQERRKRVVTLLVAIEECAPGLDVMTGSASVSTMPQSEQRRFLSNPPLRCKLAAQDAALEAALEAGVVLPLRRANKTSEAPPL